jgi:hypothetical protein
MGRVVTILLRRRSLGPGSAWRGVGTDNAPRIVRTPAGPLPSRRGPTRADASRPKSSAGETPRRGAIWYSQGPFGAEARG